MIGSGKAGDVLQQICFGQGLGQVGNVGRPYLLKLCHWKGEESSVEASNVLDLSLVVGSTMCVRLYLHLKAVGILLIVELLREDRGYIVVTYFKFSVIPTWKQPILGAFFHC
eukprot:15346270-Ditylum_brightwellii.AAC.1